MVHNAHIVGSFSNNNGRQLYQSAVNYFETSSIKLGVNIIPVESLPRFPSWRVRGGDQVALLRLARSEKWPASLFPLSLPPSPSTSLLPFPSPFPFLSAFCASNSLRSFCWSLSQFFQFLFRRIGGNTVTMSGRESPTLPSTRSSQSSSGSVAMASLMLTDDDSTVSRLDQALYAPPPGGGSS